VRCDAYPKQGDVMPKTGRSQARGSAILGRWIRSLPRRRAGAAPSSPPGAT